MKHQSRQTLTAFSSSLLLGSSLVAWACADELGTKLERAVWEAKTTDSSPRAEGRPLPETRVLAADLRDAAALPEPEAAAEDAAVPPTLDAGSVDTAPPPVRILATNGSGCAGQTASVGSVADDLSSFSIRFGGYTAVQSEELRVARLNCIFAIDVDVPPGMTYAVTSVPFGGEAVLQDGAKGRAAIQYFYQGASQTSGFGENIPEGVGDWSTAGAFAPDQVQFAPCGAKRLLLLNTSVVVNGELDGTPSSMSVDPLLAVHLQWAACQ
jgi:hypothetical protein